MSLWRRSEHINVYICRLAILRNFVKCKKFRIPKSRFPGLGLRKEQNCGKPQKSEGQILVLFTKPPPSPPQPGKRFSRRIDVYPDRNSAPWFCSVKKHSFPAAPDNNWDECHKDTHFNHSRREAINFIQRPESYRAVNAWLFYYKIKLMCFV